MKARWLIAALALAVASAASAAGSGGQSPVNSPHAIPDAGLSVVRVLGALAIVLSLFFAGVWLARNWRRFAPGPRPDHRLQILEVRPLAQRQALYLVGYQDQRLLLAASPSGICLLTELPAEAAPAAFEPQSAAPQSGAPPFAAFLDRARAAALGSGRRPFARPNP